jgi:EARP and GARP complex-interacting protein 1
MSLKMMKLIFWFFQCKDGLLKFWDLRATKQFPLLTVRGGHSHWIWNVNYNPFHDQLVLSTGTDSAVNLWRLSTISSSPLLTYDDDDDYVVGNQNISIKDAAGSNNGRTEASAPNARVGRHEHGDSVYAATWGAADAWIYVTVGYDGKATLNHVPSKEKYKILL